MAEQAQITSFDALETFRTNLILFLNKAHARVDEVGDEIRRTRGWLQSDRRVHWEGEIRRRRRALDLAEQELLNARMSSFRENLTREMVAARQAKQELVEAEEKLLNVKRWIRGYESLIAPLSKKLESLRGVLDHDLPKAVAYLVQTQQNLAEYSESGAPREAKSGPSGQPEIISEPEGAAEP
ncbi:MAG: hypothetical protein D4R65_15465 [Verrucomicrobiaceae bacterium]|nr:MAG: hypothetical protein D4R65_15465 [Verrucomicrobiaceae bacterium]